MWSIADVFAMSRPIYKYNYARYIALHMNKFDMRNMHCPWCIEVFNVSGITKKYKKNLWKSRILSIIVFIYYCKHNHGIVHFHQCNNNPKFTKNVTTCLQMTVNIIRNVQNFFGLHHVFFSKCNTRRKIANLILRSKLLVRCCFL